MVINDQVKEGGFQELPKASPVRMSLLEVATHEAEGEFLKKLVGLVPITNSPDQVAVDCRRVKLEQALLGGADHFQ